MAISLAFAHTHVIQIGTGEILAKSLVEVT